jgi:hypothetical protein
LPKFVLLQLRFALSSVSIAAIETLLQVGTFVSLCAFSAIVYSDVLMLEMQEVLSEKNYAGSSRGALPRGQFSTHDQRKI